MKRLFTLFAIIGALCCVACETGEEGPKTLTVTSPTEVNLGMYGDIITITYTISGMEDECAYVEVSAPWLAVGNHTSGTLSIRVEDNETGGTRMTAVRLSYGVSYCNIVVTQSGDVLTPSITLTSDNNIAVERMGTVVDIDYTIENINPKDYVYVKCSADWIYFMEDATTEGTRLGVATNTSGEERSTTITIGYGTATTDIALRQAGSGEIVFNAPMLTGEYLGDIYTEGVGNYWFFLTDRGFDAEGNSLANATYYRIDAYAPVNIGADGLIFIPDGKYTYDPEDTCNEWTFTAEYSGFWVTDVNGRRDSIRPFESGEMVVENGTITLTVMIDGEQHKALYSGSTELRDGSSTTNIYSTLRDDYHADLSNHTMIYECYGDEYDFGYYNWMFIIIPNGETGDCFQFDFVTGHKDEESGFYGDYVSSDYLATWAFFPGWTNGVQLLCSWYFTNERTEYAPFRDGTMSIKDNGDGTATVDIDVIDDRRNRITATWTGVPQRYAGE